MIRITIPWMVEVFEAIERLETLNDGDRLQKRVGVLFMAQRNLEGVFDQSAYSNYLRASRAAARTLYDVIQGHLDKYSDDTQLTNMDIWYLKDCKERMKQVFQAELAILPSFLVAKKGAFDTNDLLDRPLSLFPDGMVSKVPDAAIDISEAAKALAFELGTACGFHTFRALEATTRRYWDQVSPAGRARPSPETLGKFAQELEDSKLGDDKIASALKQMTKLHRNPLIHHDVILSVEEALGIMSMARSVIAPMLQVLPDVPVTTTNPGPMAQPIP